MQTSSTSPTSPTSPKPKLTKGDLKGSSTTQLAKIHANDPNDVGRVGSIPSILEQMWDQSFNQSGEAWLATILPLAQFLFLLVAITLFTIASQDMPANCPEGLHNKCLDLYVAHGGEDYLGSRCGTERVTLWRSAFKNFLYQNQELAEDTMGFDVESLRGPGDFQLNNVTFDTIAPMLYYTNCMLSGNGTEALPLHAKAWRSNTSYFCYEQGPVGQTLGVLGLLLACFIVMGQSLMEAYNEEVEAAQQRYRDRLNGNRGAEGTGAVKEEEPPHSNQNFVIVGCAAFVWLVWSIVTTVMTLGFVSNKEPPCQMPIANSFFYICIMAGLSLLGALFACFHVLKMAWKFTKAATAPDGVV